MEEFLTDVGPATQQVPSTLKVERKQKICKECIMCVLSIVFKLQECFPAQYTIVRNVSAASPVNMAE